jgi:hypothetical protein
MERNAKCDIGLIESNAKCEIRLIESNAKCEIRLIESNGKCKIRLIESNVKCRYIKKLPCKGTLRRVLICLKPPPLLGVCIYCTLSLGRRGRGGWELIREKDRGTIVHKAENINMTVSPVYKLFLTPVKTTFGFGVFVVNHGSPWFVQKITKAHIWSYLCVFILILLSSCFIELVWVVR